VRTQPSSSGNAVEIRLPTAYLREMELSSVVPPPFATQLDGEATVYRFRGASHSSEYLFRLRPRRWGRMEGAISQGNGPPAEFDQLVYP
jgi:hypothetical protein